MVTKNINLHNKKLYIDNYSYQCTIFVFDDISNYANIGAPVPRSMTTGTFRPNLAPEPMPTVGT